MARNAEAEHCVKICNCLRAYFFSIQAQLWGLVRSFAWEFTANLAVRHKSRGMVWRPGQPSDLLVKHLQARDVVGSISFAAPLRQDRKGIARCLVGHWRASTTRLVVAVLHTATIQTTATSHNPFNSPLITRSLNLNLFKRKLTGVTVHDQM